MRTGRNVAANYVGVAWTALLSIAFVPVYIRLLGIEAYALVGLYAVIQAWLALLDMGLTPTLVRETARFSSGRLSAREIGTLVRSLEAVFAVIGILVTLVLAGLASIIAHRWLHAASLSPATITLCITLMGLIVAFRFFEGLYRSALIGLHDQVWMSLASAINATIRYVGSIGVLLLVSRSIQAFFVWNVVASVIATAIYRYRVGQGLRGGLRGARPSLRALDRIKQFAGGMSGIIILTLLLNQLDKVLLSRFVPLATFGYYMFASTAASVLLVIVSPVTQAFYPRFVAVHEEPAALHALSRLAMQTILLVLVPLAAMLCLLPHQIILAWSNNPVLAMAGAPLLAAMTVGNLLNGVTQVPYNLNLASGRTRSNLLAFSGGVLFMVPALLLLVPWGGALAAAWMWGAINLLLIVLIVLFTPRGLLPLATMAAMIRDLVVTSTAAAAVVLLARAMLPMQDVARWVQIAWLALTGSLAGLATLLCLSDLRAYAAALLVRVLRRWHDRRTASASDRR